ncbi:MAG: hypothetical protein ACJAWS_001649 [Oleiphilaceae bacterium]|jgi:hypothetical protein
MIFVKRGATMPNIFKLRVQLFFRIGGVLMIANAF